MAQLISEIWAGLREAGLPEVMLYLPDNSASRCHWDDTALIGEVRVALLADQDRQIVRILPVDSCVGIGIASPKGVDPSGYRREVFNKLRGDLVEGGAADAGDGVANYHDPSSPLDVTPTGAAFPAPAYPVMAMPSPPPPPPAAEPPPKPDPLASRWGVAMRPPAPTRSAGGR